MEAVATIDIAMLEHVWQELDYRRDVCHVTNEAYIEHLKTFIKYLRLQAFRIYQMRCQDLNNF